MDKLTVLLQLLLLLVVILNSAGQRWCVVRELCSVFIVVASVKLDGFRVFTQMTRRQNFDATAEFDRTGFLTLSIGRHIKLDARPSKVWCWHQKSDPPCENSNSLQKFGAST